MPWQLLTGGTAVKAHPQNQTPTNSVHKNPVHLSPHHRRSHPQRIYQRGFVECSSFASTPNLLDYSDALHPPSSASDALPKFVTHTRHHTALGRHIRICCGVDASEPLLAMAREYCAHQPQVEFRLADAVHLDFPNDHFDVGVSTQVYEYVPAVDAALAELYRVLKPGGRAVILETDWDAIVWHTTNRERMNHILTVWAEHLTDPYLPRTLTSKLRRVGF
ncbi:MAG: hypothetical protein B6D41_00535 [Chloroflexi bacterium UTCFX4]|jgi:SAM-dependent methyltransferase|nr:MAG: hypothetical protein B6D41_00535 [Chloroflexi bacterium UTCFX4]